MATDLASLVVKLEAQTAQYMAGMERAQKALERFSKSSATVATAVGTAFANVGVALGQAFLRMGKAAVDNADELNKLSQSTGVTVEALSQLQYAADLSGLSTEELGASLGKLARSATDAAEGAKKPAAAFDQLGVSVKRTDGSLKSTEELLLDVAERFSALQDSAQKSALAQDIFGKAGAKLIPFLNQGRDGIEKLRKEADAFGLTITTASGQAAERFNDNLTVLQGTVSGLVNRFIQQALPTFELIAEKFVNAARDGGVLDAAVRGLSVAFKSLVSAGVIITSVFQQVGLAINGFINALALVAQGRVTDAVDIFKDRFSQMRANVEKDVESIAKIWAEETPKIEAAARDAGERMSKPIDQAAKEIADNALKTIQSLADGIRQQVGTFDLGAKAAIEYRIAHGDLADEFRKAGAAGEALKQQIIGNTEILALLQERTSKAKEAEEEANRVRQEGMQLFESLRTPAETYEATLARLSDMLRQGAIDQETYARAVQQAKDQLQSAQFGDQQAAAYDVASEALVRYNMRIAELTQLLQAGTINQDAFNKAAGAAKGSLDQAVEGTRQGAQELQGFITQALTGGFEDGAKGILRGFINMLLQMQAQALAARLTQSLFGGAGQNAGFGAAVASFFGGTRAQGGDVRGGREYLVGERGPERFVPDVNGTIISNQQLAPQVTVKPQVINVRDPSEIPTAIQSGAGEAAVLNIIGRNNSVIKQLLQGG